MPFDSATSPRKIAILRDRLFVSGEFVTEEMLLAYQSELSIGTAPGQDPETGETILVPIKETINHYQIQYMSADQVLYSFNRGDLNKLYRVFKDFEIIDERMNEPMRSKLKIRFGEGKGWREYQPDAIEALIQHDYGLLKAPPRSGKTLMMAATICMERQKTIIFAHQTDLLVQLYDTFLEFTNLSDLQAPGTPVVGFAESIEDFDNLDVVLCTKQTFDHYVNKGMLPIIQKMFGSVWIDECHFLAADVYSKLINRFWAKTRRGVTATPHRKDGMDVVTEGIIGDTVHTITPEQVKQVPIEVFKINTGVKLREKNFTKIQTVLAENDLRNRLIVDHMKRDVVAGHIIIAVTDRKDHQQEISNLLKEAGIACELFNGDLGANRPLRKKILNRIRNKEVPILICMRGMTTGLDIPCADMFYNMLLSSNAVKEGEWMGEGGYEQQCTRIRTDYPGKTKGLIRDFVDDFGVAYSCWKERKKTYAKLGALIHKSEDATPSFAMMSMDDGL